LFAPNFSKVKEVLESGVLGTPLQYNLRYSGFSHRWDWQTILACCAGGLYNTAPHPIGIGLDLLGWPADAKVLLSRLDTALTSGDANDMAKIIIGAEGKPLLDIEVNSADAYPQKNIKILCDRGTLLTNTTGDVQIKYIVDAELEPRPVIKTPLAKPENGNPMYCSEKLPIHEETVPVESDYFTVGTQMFYQQLYNAVMNGAPLEITPEKGMKAIEIIEAVHAQNPLPLKY
jgi:predicted dehydrogenase